jgi:hypothetical protein
MGSMRGKAEKSIQSLTGAQRPKNSMLSQLLRRTECYEAMEAQIQGAISTRLQGQIQVACVEGEQLIVAVPSSAWVARARLEAQAMIKAAQGVWDGPLSEVKVIVGPTPPKP